MSRTVRASGLSDFPPPHSWALSEVVGQLIEAGSSFDGEPSTVIGRYPLPSREALISITTALRAVLFPAHLGATDLTEDGLAYFIGHTLDDALVALKAQVGRALHFTTDLDAFDAQQCEERAYGITRAFAARLPVVRSLLGSDVRAAFEGDPAATSIDEAVFCYPGVAAITHHRVAHELHVLGVPMIPRIISEISHGVTGIDIHPAAQIGPNFFIDHGTGVVIGETCAIGRRVRIYQGVTLGAKSFPIDDRGVLRKGEERHPIVEDDVVIHAGATILGRITIGRESIIGGNVWLTRSVPARSQITQAQVQSQVFENGSGI